mmetsp:Transcript_16043/g.38286  ORF Transcript_16043/g.38286 Transcript_16043/m.38286 type:complete len:288 (-) Transcript_16043:843-1706(-)
MQIPIYTLTNPSPRRVYVCVCVCVWSEWSVAVVDGGPAPEGGLADRVHLKTDVGQLVVVEYVPAVEEECGLAHPLAEQTVVVTLESVPLGEDEDGVRVLHRRLGVLLPEELFFEVEFEPVVPELLQRLLAGHLGVVNVQDRTVRHQQRTHSQCGCLARVAGVLLEGESEYGDLLAVDRVEHGVDHFSGEVVLLDFVHVDHLLPVRSHLRQAERLAQVHQVENVLLEARASEADGCVEELGTDAAVQTDGVRNFLDVGTGLLAQHGDGVDGRDALSQERIRDEFGEFG